MSEIIPPELVEKAAEVFRKSESFYAIDCMREALQAVLPDLRNYSANYWLNEATKARKLLRDASHQADLFWASTVREKDERITELEAQRNGVMEGRNRETVILQKQLTECRYVMHEKDEEIAALEAEVEVEQKNALSWYGEHEEARANQERSDQACMAAIEAAAELEDEIERLKDQLYRTMNAHEERKTEVERLRGVNREALARNIKLGDELTELKAMLPIAIKTIKGLADQQAMEDNWYLEPLATLEKTKEIVS